MDGEYVVYYDSQSEMDIKKTPCTTLIQMILMWDTIGQKKRLKVNTKYIQPMKIHTLCVCWKGGSKAKAWVVFQHGRHEGIPPSCVGEGDCCVRSHSHYFFQPIWTLIVASWQPIWSPKRGPIYFLLEQHFKCFFVAGL